MKRRWIAALLFAAVVALAACTPQEGGAGSATPGPADFYDGY